MSTQRITDKKEPSRFSISAIIVHFVLAGIVVLFLTFVYSYIFNNNKAKWTDFRLPKIFWLSTVAILLVSWFMKKAVSAYKSDRIRALRANLITAFVLAILFLICQTIGWIQLRPVWEHAASTTSSDYVYVISFVHAVHVTAGILFLIVAIVRCFRASLDEVRTLLYLTDPVRKLRIRLLSHYWHTIDFLWMFLFLSFLYMHA